MSVKVVGGMVEVNLSPEEATAIAAAIEAGSYVLQDPQFDHIDAIGQALALAGELGEMQRTVPYNVTPLEYLQQLEAQRAQARSG
jgi:hypothetical protein